MAHYAIIDTTTNKVVNIIEYEDHPGERPPGFDETHIAVPFGKQMSGDWRDWVWDGRRLSSPN